MGRMNSVVLCGIAVACAAAQAQEAPSATPYRPTVSNPAELSAPGWLELEAGWLGNRAGDDRRRSLPYLAKVAFDENWGVMLGGDARVKAWNADDRLSGFGDTSLTVKHRIATADENINFGVEAGGKMPTARTGLGSGKPDWTVNGIASIDVAEDWRLDANLGATRLGARPDAARRTSFLWAAALSHAIGDWTLAAELAGTRQGGVPGSRQWLVAASYAVAPRLVADFGTAVSRQDGVSQRSYFLGMTWLAARFF